MSQQDRTRELATYASHLNFDNLPVKFMEKAKAVKSIQKWRSFFGKIIPYFLDRPFSLHDFMAVPRYAKCFRTTPSLFLAERILGLIPNVTAKCKENRPGPHSLHFGGELKYCIPIDT